MTQLPPASLLLLPCSSACDLSAAFHKLHHRCLSLACWQVNNEADVLKAIQGVLDERGRGEQLVMFDQVGVVRSGFIC